jgi:aquaporin Z
MFDETNWKTVSAEMLGTFFLVFFGIAAFASSDDAFAGALTLGLTLMVLMHVFGPISGCHLNPAVTIGNMMSKKTSQDDAIAYMAAQVVGATFGWFLLSYLDPNRANAITMMNGDVAILVAAAVGTMFFVMTLLSTQDPFAVGAALFVVSSAAFHDVNAGAALGVMVFDGTIMDFAFFGVIGSVIGAFAGWAVKDNCLD